MEKSARNAIFKGFFQNSLLGTFESKQTLRQQIKKQTFPKATFQRILRILLGNEVYHTEDAYRIAKGGALACLAFAFSAKLTFYFLFLRVSRRNLSGKFKPL